MTESPRASGCAVAAVLRGVLRGGTNPSSSCPRHDYQKPSRSRRHCAGSVSACVGAVGSDRRDAGRGRIPAPNRDERLPRPPQEACLGREAGGPDSARARRTRGGGGSIGRGVAADLASSPAASRARPYRRAWLLLGGGGHDARDQRFGRARAPPAGSLSAEAPDGGDGWLIFEPSSDKRWSGGRRPRTRSTLSFVAGTGHCETEGSLQRSLASASPLAPGCPSLGRFARDWSPLKLRLQRQVFRPHSRL